MAEGITLRSLQSHLVLGTRGWEQGMRRVTADTKTIGGLMRSAGTAVRGFGKVLTIAGGALTAMSGLLAKNAMAAEESENLFAVSMGKMADSTREWSVALSEQLNLNEFEVRRMAAVLNVMFESMGTGADQAQKMAHDLTQLANDMSSFYDIALVDAFTKLSAGISGEIEPLKRLGVIVNVNAVMQDKWVKSLGKTWAKMTEGEKVIGRYNTIMSQTRKAQGDLLRTLDSATNMQRSVGELWKQISIELGTALLPSMKKIYGWMQKILKRGRLWIKQNKDLAVTLVKLGAKLGLAFIAVGTFLMILPTLASSLQIIGGLIIKTLVMPLVLATKAVMLFGKAAFASLSLAAKGFKLLRTAAIVTWAALSAPVVATVAAIASIGFAIVVLRGMWKQNTFDIQGQTKQMWKSVVDTTKAALATIFDWFVSVFSKVGQWIKAFFNGMIGEISGAGAFIGALAGGATIDEALAARSAEKQRDFVGNLLKGITEEAKISGQALLIMGKESIEALEPLADKTLEFAKEAAQGLKDAGSHFTEGLREAMPDVKKQLDADFGGMVDSVKGSYDKMTGAMTSWSDSTISNIDNVQNKMTDFANQLETLSGLIQDSLTLDSRYKGTFYGESPGIGQFPLSERFTPGGFFDPTYTQQTPAGAYVDTSTNKPLPSGLGGIYGGAPQPVTVVIQNQLDSDRLAGAVFSSPAGQDGAVQSVMNNFFDGGEVRTHLNPQPQ